MNDIIIAIITGLSVAIPGIITTIVSNRSNVKLTIYRIDELEKKVNKHNQIVERTYKLEGQMQEAQHDITDLKSKVG